jgi:ketosteroid isomerase-like protein
METRDVAEAFVNAINGGRAERISAMMALDHVFIDSLGVETRGRRAMLEGWRAYLRLFPDYRIEVDGWFVEEQVALLHGKASGTLHRDIRPVPDGAWRIPAAWRLVSDGKKVVSWQVFADNKPVYALLGG